VRLYWEMARRGYRRFAAYPAATWAGVFTNTVFGFMLAYILLAVYERRDNVGGYDEVDAITYVWLAQGLLATVWFMGWREIGDRIRSGDIATDLARPAHPLWIGLASDLGRGLYHTLYRGLPPFILGALVFELTAPRNPLVWLGFAFSVPLAVCASYAFRVLYNLTAFWLLEDRGPRVFATTVALFFSGFVIPVRFFPDWLATVAHATPFPSMLQIPIDIFVGKAEGVELLGALATQAAWTLALLGAAYGVYALGTRRLVVQGG
jgi:ABC-2 type transport system permease protein